jgi:hypothetical protein
MPRVSTTVPALPLHCRSGFSRDALRHTHQKASGLKTLLQRAGPMASPPPQHPNTPSLLPFDELRTGSAAPRQGPSDFGFAGAVQIQASKLRRWTPACAGVTETGRLRFPGFTPQRAGPMAQASMACAAFPLHCRSGFSRDAFPQHAKKHSPARRSCEGRKPKRTFATRMARRLSRRSGASPSDPPRQNLRCASQFVTGQLRPTKPTPTTSVA